MKSAKITRNDADLIVWEDGTIIREAFIDSAERRIPEKELMVCSVSRIGTEQHWWQVGIRSKKYNVARLIAEAFKIAPSHLKNRQWYIPYTQERPSLHNIKIITLKERLHRRPPRGAVPYKGVCVNNEGSSPRYIASLGLTETERQYIGSFRSAEEAARAVNQFILENDLETYRLNKIPQ